MRTKRRNVERKGERKKIGAYARPCVRLFYCQLFSAASLTHVRARGGEGGGGRRARDARFDKASAEFFPREWKARARARARVNRTGTRDTVHSRTTQKRPCLCVCVLLTPAISFPFFFFLSRRPPPSSPPPSPPLPSPPSRGTSSSSAPSVRPRRRHRAFSYTNITHALANTRRTVVYTVTRVLRYATRPSVLISLCLSSRGNVKSTRSKVKPSLFL